MVPPKGVYLLISKLHSILAVANLIAHNNITISYFVQVNSLRLKSSVASKWASTIFGGNIFLLLMVFRRCKGGKEQYCTWKQIALFLLLDEAKQQQAAILLQTNIDNVKQKLRGVKTVLLQYSLISFSFGLQKRFLKLIMCTIKLEH